MEIMLGRQKGKTLPKENVERDKGQKEEERLINFIFLI